MNTTVFCPNFLTVKTLKFFPSGNRNIERKLENLHAACKFSNFRNFVMENGWVPFEKELNRFPWHKDSKQMCGRKSEPFFITRQSSITSWIKKVDLCSFHNLIAPLQNSIGFLTHPRVDPSKWAEKSSLSFIQRKRVWRFPWFRMLITA